MDPKRDRASRPAFRRTTYLIDRAFQLRYTLMMVFMWTMSSAVFGLTVSTVFIQARTPPEEGLGSARLGLLVGIAVCFLAALVFLSILMTHRISGPLLIIRRLLRTMEEGKLPVVVRPLRQDDELKPVFEQLRNVIDLQRQKEQQEAERLEASVQALRPLASSPEAERLLAELAGLASQKRAAILTAPDGAAEPKEGQEPVLATSGS